MQAKHIKHNILIIAFTLLLFTTARAENNSFNGLEIITEDSGLTGVCGFHILDQKARQMGVVQSEPTQKSLRNRGKQDEQGNTIDDYVGQEVDFWTYNFYTRSDEQIRATCKSVGEHCYIYVSNAETIAQGTINAIANEFDSNIYNTDRACFGSEWKPGIDGDSRITILIFNIKDERYYNPSVNVYTAGYFYSLDETSYYHSNQREMFYMDCNPATPGSNSFYHTLAHEFQHMIHWNEDPNEDTWVNEGCSGYAEFICGYGWRKPTHFFSNPDDKLTTWNQQLIDYEQCFLFILYLYEQFGGANTIKSIVQEPANGSQGIMNVLQSLGHSLSFNQIFQNWVAANYLDDTGIDEGQYGYSNINLATYPITPAQSWVSYPASASGSVNSYAADYIKFSNGSSMDFTFNGASSGLLLKKGPSGNEVESISGVKSVADFGSTFDEIILVANGYGSSMSYSYSAQATAADETNLAVYTGSGANNSSSYNSTNHTCTFNISVENTGDLSVSSFRVGFYLSANSTITATDYLLTFKTITDLASGQYVTLSGSVNLDDFSIAELPVGVYYAGALIDYNNTIAETNENDNSHVYSETIDWAGPPPVTPDLVIYTGSGAINTFQYNAMTRVCSFQSTVKNADAGTAGSFRVGWYLSTDQDITTADKLLAYSQLSSLAANSTVTLTGTRNLEEICDQLEPAVYYAGAIIDYNNTVIESNEFNNDYVWQSPQVNWNGCRTPVAVTMGQDWQCGANAGDTFTARLTVDDVTGKEIYAYGFDLQFNTSDLQVTEVRSVNTITATWGEPVYNNVSGGIRVSGAGAVALNGAGAMLEIDFSVAKNHQHGDSTALNLQNFMFNEGSPAANITNGQVTYIGSLAISGYTRYYQNNTPVNGVTLTLTGSVSDSQLSNADGHYIFTNLQYGSNYDLLASKAKSSEKEPAISTFDAACILRYFVDTLTLNEEQKIAADVSNNGEISPFDASIILRYYVEQDVSQYTIGAWKFIKPSSSNWLSPDTVYSYASLNNNQPEQNLTGILIGDVSGNWAGSELSKGTDRILTAGNISLLQSNVLEIPVQIQGTTAFHSTGINMTIDKEKYTVENVALAVGVENVMLAWQENQGQLRIAAVSANEIKNAALLNITLKSLNGDMQNTKIIVNNYEIDANSFDSTMEWDIALAQIPERFALLQNYPNPFNPSTRIDYSLANTVHVKLSIYNTLGQKIYELVNETQNAGVYNREWNGRDQTGLDAPSGVYLARLSAGKYQKTIKIVKTK